MTLWQSVTKPLGSFALPQHFELAQLYEDREEEYER